MYAEPLNLHRAVYTYHLGRVELLTYIIASLCRYQTFEPELLHYQTFESMDAAYIFAFHPQNMHTFIHLNSMHTHQKKLTISLPHPEDDDSLDKDT